MYTGSNTRSCLSSHAAPKVMTCCFIGFRFGSTRPVGPKRADLVRVVGRLAVIVVLDEPHGREAAVGGCGAAAQRAVVALRIALRDDQVVVRVIQRVHAIVPVSAAEAALRQVELHDVVEVPEAARNLDLAVVQQVVSRAQAWGDLLAPSEADAFEPGQRVIGGQVFLVQAQAEIQRQTSWRRSRRPARRKRDSSCPPCRWRR